LIAGRHGAGCEVPAGSPIFVGVKGLLNTTTCVSAVVRFRSRVLSHETKRETKIKTYSLHLTAPLQKHFVVGSLFLLLNFDYSIHSNQSVFVIRVLTSQHSDFVIVGIDLFTSSFELTRPEKSLHFLVKSPDTNLHFLVSPEIALHLITG